MPEMNPIASHHGYIVWESRDGVQHLTTPNGHTIDEAGMAALALVLAEIRCDERHPEYGDPCDLPVGHTGVHFATQVNGMSDPQWD